MARRESPPREPAARARRRGALTGALTRGPAAASVTSPFGYGRCQKLTVRQKDGF